MVFLKDAQKIGSINSTFFCTLFLSKNIIRNAKLPIGMDVTRVYFIRQQVIRIFHIAKNRLMIIKDRLTSHILDKNKIALFASFYGLTSKMFTPLGLK